MFFSIHSDNSGAVHTWTQGTTRNVEITEMARRIFFTAAIINDFAVENSHVAAASNKIADQLSRFQREKFQKLTPAAMQSGIELPELLSRLRPLMESAKGQTIWAELPTDLSTKEWPLLPEELTSASAEY